MALDKAKAIRVERKRSPNGTQYPTYVFICSGCPGEIRSQHNYLKKHSGLCTSCVQKRGHGPYYAAYMNMARQAQKLDAEYMSEAEYEYIRESDECHYCEGRVPITARGYFIDRRNPNGDYTINNAVLCCWPCNQAKGNRYTYAEFAAISELLREMRSPKARARKQAIVDSLKSGSG